MSALTAPVDGYQNRDGQLNARAWNELTVSGIFMSLSIHAAQGLLTRRDGMTVLLSSLWYDTLTIIGEKLL